MAWCCRKSSGMGPTVAEQLGAKIASIDQIYPGTHFACLVSLEGRYIAGCFSEGRHQQAEAKDEVCQAVASLKRAATQFALTLGQTDCSIAHLCGGTNLFSFYDVGGNCDTILAFYSEVGDEMPVSNIDTSKADVLMGDLIVELRLLLEGSNVISPGLSPHGSIAGGGGAAAVKGSQGAIPNQFVAPHRNI